MSENFVKPKAPKPEVWVLSLLAIIMGIAFSKIAETEHQELQREQHQELQNECSEISARPAFEENLGTYTYQYFSTTNKEDAYFRLLKGENEVFRQSSGKAIYNLIPIESVDISRYGYQPEPINYVVTLPSKKSLIVVEEVEEVQEQRHYFVVDLAEPIRVVAELKSGSNQFVLRYTDRSGLLQLIGNDQLEAWGQQPVNPRAVFDLADSKKQKLALRLHKVGPRKQVELVRHSKDLQALFANLSITEEAAITFAPAELAAEMAELIYEGNGKQAKFLLDRSWPRHTRGKALFEKAFRAELAKGSFNDQVAALNQL